MYIVVYNKNMNERIHKNKPTKRIAIGVPFEELVDELLKSTNNENLSRKWNQTDMTRYALAELWRTRKNKSLPKSCEELLPRFYADLDL